jgi:hypothetical protein
MAHQDYSQICPIFKEGVEKEIGPYPIQASSSLSTQSPTFRINFGREVTLQDILVGSYLSTTCFSTSVSFSAQIFKMGNNVSGSCSNCIGSIAFGSALMSLTGDCCHVSASLATGAATLSFTSTDWLGIAITGVAEIAAATAYTPKLLIRYKDK